MSAAPLSWPARLRRTAGEYPRQFWLLFFGSLVSSSGSSMVWPFLTIYIRQRLGVPLTDVALVLTVNAVAGFFSMSLAGPAADRFGRKWLMVIGLVVGGATMVAAIVADSMAAILLVMAVNGAFSPLVGVGASTMIADIIPPEKRAGAYALLRMIQNLGVAIGPTIGGFIAVISYSIAFGVAAGTSLTFALLILFFAAETMPARGDRETAGAAGRPAHARAEAGYGPVFRDRRFMAFAGVYTITGMVGAMMMILLPVYGKENFGVLENQYGFIMATNAVMVVTLQFAITRFSSIRPHFLVLAAGSLFYGVGAGSIALGWNFPTFLLSMVILTIGEMLIVPTATTLTANLAPPDMRGRYMSVYSLTWGLAFGVGPVIGGLLNDHVAPVAIWYGTLVLGLMGTVGFLVLSRTRQQTQGEIA
jgi:MFS family permease